MLAGTRTRKRCRAAAHIMLVLLLTVGLGLGACARKAPPEHPPDSDFPRQYPSR